MIAFHVLAIWLIPAKGVKDKATLIKEMFYDLELEEGCADIFDKSPWVISERDETGTGNKVNNIQMGTKILGKGQKSKSSTAVNEGNFSSINPLNPGIWKNRCQSWLMILKMMTAVQVGISNHNH